MKANTETEQRWLVAIARIGGGLAIALGAAALFRWITALSTSYTVSSGWEPTPPSATLLILVFGVLLLSSPSKNRQKVATTIGAGACVFAVALLVLPLLGLTLRIESLWRTVSGLSNSAPIVTVSPLTGMCLAAVGLTYWLLRHPLPSGGWHARAAAILSASLLLASILLTAADLLGNPRLYERGITPTALTASLSFLALGAALLAKSGQQLLAQQSQANAQAMHLPYGIFSIFAILSVGIVVIANAYFQDYQERFRQEVESELAAVAELKVDELERWRTERLGDARYFYANADFATLVQQVFTDSADPALRTRLETQLGRLQSTDSYQQVSILDIQGTELLSIPPTDNPAAPPLALAAREAARTGEIQFVDFYRPAPERPVELAIAVPVAADPASKDVIGVLALQIDPNAYLYPTIQRWPTPRATAETLLVRQVGDDVLFLNDLRFQEDAALRLRAPLSNTSLPAAMAIRGVEGLVEGLDYRDVPVAATVRPIPDSAWFLVAKIDITEIYEPLRERLLIVLASMGFLLVAAAGGAGAIWQRNSKREYRAHYEAQTRFRTTLQSIGDGVIATDGAGQIAFLNPVAESLTGWTAEQARGHRLDEVFTIIDEQTRAPREFPDRLALAEGQAVELANHTLLITRDGREIPIADSAAPIADPDGNTTGVVLTFQDQTEQRRARGRLEKEMARAQEYLNIAGAIILVLDVDGYVTLINRAGCDLLGRSESEVLGEDWYERFVPHDEGIRVSGALRRMVTEDLGTNMVQENRIITSDGSERLIAWRNALIRDEKGKVTGVLSSGEDITERRQAQEALRESEAALRKAQHIAHVGSWTWHANDRRFVWSDEMSRIFSVDEDGYDGSHQDLSSLAAIHPEDRARVNAAQQSIMKKGSFAPFEFRVIDSEGQTHFVWVEVGERNLDAAGNPATVTGIVQDITERRRAEMERQALLTRIEKQATQITEIVEAVPEGVFLLDATGRVQLTNPAARDQIVRLSDSEHVAAGTQPITRLGDRPLNELLTSPPRGTWHDIRAGDRVYEAIARPIVEGPEPERWVLVIRDVTEQRSVRDQLQQQERLAAVGQLAAGIAHDFNNIMGVIVLHAQMAATSGDLSAKNQGRLTTINQQAHHAAQLIQQILDFSRHGAVERRPLDLLPILREQVALLKRTLPESITIRLAHDQATNKVSADPTRIQQVIMNLAVNARDAMPEGGTLTIGLGSLHLDRNTTPPVTGMPPGDWLMMTVADTGTGIPPRVLPHIYEPFYTTKPPGSGSGLGLSQVHGIVAQHDGYIDVQTILQGGTTFTIYLPAISEVDGTTPVLSTEDTPSGSGELILVVEDNPTLRMALCEALRGSGYEVCEADNGIEALARLTRPDSGISLVLSDVVMPKMGGLALARALRERGNDVPLVLLSGHPKQTGLDDVRTHGVYKWLPKPPDLDELARVISEAINHKA